MTTKKVEMNPSVKLYDYEIDNLNRTDRYSRKKRNRTRKTTRTQMSYTKDKKNYRLRKYQMSSVSGRSKSSG